MTKEQLIQIAKVGFCEKVKQFINFDNCEMFHMSDVYRLYDKEDGLCFVLPKNTILAICIYPNKFVQITCGNKSFNHYAAIKEMEKLNLIK
jgi:hypothetical protein